MKVRCIRLISHVDGSEMTDSPWLTVGRQYLVVSVVAVPGRHVSLQIINDQSRLGMFDSRMFTTSHHSVPPNWVVKVSHEGVLEFAPEPWQEAGFWERFYNDEPEAIRICEEEISKILSDSPQ